MQSTDWVQVLVFALHERNSSMMGCRLCLRGEKFLIPRSVQDLLFDVLSKAKGEGVYISATVPSHVFIDAVDSFLFALHQRTSSISELLCSSMPLIGFYLHYITPGVCCDWPRQLHSLPPRHAIDSVEVSEAEAQLLP